MQEPLLQSFPGPATNMIFALDEDGTLAVLEDINEARKQFESWHVEEGNVVFYDEWGHPLEPLFPHRSDRRFLGLRIDSDPGPLEFRPATSGRGPSFASALSGKVFLSPNRWFATLAQLQEYVAAHES